MAPASPWQSAQSLALRPAGPRRLVVLALSMVALRLALFDYVTFFQLRSIPNHDMYQAASLFATSMHAMRVEGDLAWWNPVTDTGYAQYYPALLSPMAPTLGHVVFIAWAQTIFLLGLLGVAIPEYFQYLVLTYVVFPFLAVLGFGFFCRLLFRTTAAVALGMIVFTLSTIGLWHSAWFYFQEPATLWFLLGAAIAFLRRPTAQRVLLLLAALLVQLASFNYWTLFNSWFVVIFLGSYAAVYRVQVRRAVRRLVTMIRRRPAVAAVGATGMLVVAALWSAVVATAIQDEAPVLRREYSRRGPAFELSDALRFIDPSFYLVRAFHPDIMTVVPEPSEANHLIMRHAVYVGAFLVPLLLAITFQRWRRTERWLVLAAAGLLAVCLAAPPAQWAWEHVPWMNRIRHLFLFYPTFVRLILLLLCCSTFDRLLNGPPITARRRTDALMSLALGVTAVLLLGGVGLDRLSRLGGLLTGLLPVIPALFLALVVIRPTPRRRGLFAGVVLLVALGDLATYFQQLSRLDNDFTATRWATQRPIPPAVAQALRRPWARLDPDHPRALFDNMPIKNDLWPVNSYMPHSYVIEHGSREQDDPWERQFAGFRPAPDRTWMAGLPQDTLSPLPFEWHRRTYNHWRAAVESPGPGWISVAQLHDPGWRATVDGEPVKIERANIVRTAVPVGGGRHELEMVYRPRARRLYWPAAAALETMVLLLLVLGRVTRRRRHPRSIGEGVPVAPSAARPGGPRRVPDGRLRDALDCIHHEWTLRRP